MINRRSLFSLFAGAAVGAPAVAKMAAQSTVTPKPVLEPMAANYPSLLKPANAASHSHTFVTVADPVHTHTFPSSDLPSGSQIWFYETVPHGWKFVRYGGDPMAVLCEKI